MSGNRSGSVGGALGTRHTVGVHSCVLAQRIQSLQGTTKLGKTTLHSPVWEVTQFSGLRGNVELCQSWHLFFPLFLF